MDGFSDRESARGSAVEKPGAAPRIVVGTLGHGALIDRLAASG